MWHGSNYVRPAKLGDSIRVYDPTGNKYTEIKYPGGLLASISAQGSAFGGYTTAKTILPAAGLVTIPANTLAVGSMFQITVLGAISNIVTTPGTIVFQVMFGAVIAFTTSTVQMSTTAHTLAPFKLVVDLTCYTIGATTTATMMGQAVLTSQAIVAASGADSVATHGVVMAPSTAPAVGTGFDSTAANIIDFWAGFSISNAGNAVQISQYRVEGK